MNKAVSIFLLIISWSSSFAQTQGQERIDSLLTELPTSNDDSNKVNILIDLSFNYNSIDPDEGIKYGRQALGLSEKLNWKKGIADANRTIGVNYCYGKSEYATSIEYFLKSLSLYEYMWRFPHIQYIHNIFF